MDRLRQHFHRRRRSSSASSATTPLQPPKSPTLTTHDRKKKSDIAPRRLYITSNSAEFDPSIIRNFQAEGFEVEYVPFVRAEIGEDIERDRKEVEKLLHEREDDLEPGERYAVVAYNYPAYLLLLSHHQPATATNPFPRLCALVTYYPEAPESLSTSAFNYSNTSPTCNPSTHTILPQSTTSSTTPSDYTTLSLLPIQIHLAGHQSPALWDRYAGHPSKKRHRCHLFFYPDSEPGFAQRPIIPTASSASRSSPKGSLSSTYDGISARLAWSRALDCVKRGFGWPGGNWDIPEVEGVWEEYWRTLFRGEGGEHGNEVDMDGTNSNGGTLFDGGVGRTLDVMVGCGDRVEERKGSAGGSRSRSRKGSRSGGSGKSSPLREEGEWNGLGDVDGTPSVYCVPTMVGGTTKPTLQTFYNTQFFPHGPADQKIRLLSRTIGPNRIVDELLLTFTHTEEIPWLLPSVPPTDKEVRVVLIMTAMFVAGKIARHNVYWDQASVLVQVGLLDPALVPGGFRATGVNREGSGEVERVPVFGGEWVDLVLS